ncbi:replicative DNA helicase [Mycobacterium paragordonae]|uniref:Replicative DNA helicase n=1 Tax=Mycobacterium paragordonae TaxID=1389713 RepID=A0AAJ1S976_9MYCO|nr:replicative DNA helicase [Mycobacterium paragordonae]MDP7739678.1 replicative DNA helicase [Mycobacterium paragordonae]
MDLQSKPQSQSEGRLPPQDFIAEQSVLGAMMLSKDAIADAIERLHPHDFYRPAHQKIHEAIINLYGQGEPADAITVAAELDRQGQLQRIGGATYIHTLIAIVPTAANAGYYADIVAEKAVLRRLVEAGTRIVQYGYAGADGAEVPEVLARAQAEMFEATNGRRTEDFVALEELLQPTMDELETIQNDGGIARGVPTGFHDIDEVLNGLHGGQMIIIAARPGIGKALALDTPLPTPHGWTTMGEVNAGQELIGADGKPTRIIAATDTMYERPSYAIEFDESCTIIADGSHQWPTLNGLRTTTQLRPGADAITGAVPLMGAQHVVTAIRPVASVPVRCVQVDNVDHTYLAGRAMVPTHNSTLGLDILRSCSIKHHLPGIIFSLEMSKSEIAMRLLSAEASVKLADMRAGKMSDSDWAKIARRMSQLSEAPLFIDDSPNLAMPEIRAKSRRLAQQHNLRLIVIDYLQLMSSGKKVESRQQEVSDLSRNIKLLAKDLDVPIIAISQLNRGPEQRQDKRPHISDLRESGSLEQDCDVALLLHRPDATDRDDPRAGEADVIIGKHRNGETKTITLVHQLHLSRFSDMARGI